MRSKTLPRCQGGILARVHNSLPTAPRDFGFPNITVHFYGGDQPAAADGFPHDLVNRPADFPNVTIPAGGCHDYQYPFIDVGALDQPIEQDEDMAMMGRFDVVD
jgi:hypothetical protein